MLGTFALGVLMIIISPFLVLRQIGLTLAIAAYCACVVCVSMELDKYKNEQRMGKPGARGSESDSKVA